MQNIKMSLKCQRTLIVNIGDNHGKCVNVSICLAVRVKKS